MPSDDMKLRLVAFCDGDRFDPSLDSCGRFGEVKDPDMVDM